MKCLPMTYPFLLQQCHFCLVKPILNPHCERSKGYFIFFFKYKTSAYEVKNKTSYFSHKSDTLKIWLAVDNREFAILVFDATLPLMA